MVGDADTNALELSDAEFLKMGPEAFAPEESTSVEQDQGTEDSSVNEDVSAESEVSDDTTTLPSDTDDSADDNSEAQEQTTDSEAEEEVGQPDGDTQTEHESSEEDEEVESLDTSDADSPDTDGDTQETTEFDYKSAYDKVTKPFKANGIEMQVSEPDDIVRLMQMGANYQKKMAQIKPQLQVVKMLEKHDLLDADKLNNLIDISKKDPKAIAKLMQDSGIDPIDVDTESASTYEPNDYSVSDKEYALDEVLESIKDTPSFTRTIDTLTKEWDTQSRSTISDNPEIIGIINMHMENGVYDKVNEVMQREKTLGKLSGIPDVEAYRQVAEQLAQSGVLRQQEPAKTAKEKAPSKVSSESNPSQKQSAERKQKRKAAAPTKASKQPMKDTGGDDFLGLSDEEFMKKFGSS